MSEPAKRSDAHRSRTTVRVRYPETDRMGIAYHGHYLAWFELGRTELMRELGCAYQELEDQRGIHFPVIQVGARYHASARYDELLEIHTRLTEVGGVRVRFEYEVMRSETSKLLASGFTEHAAVGRNGRAMRLPVDVRARLGAGGRP